MEKAAGLTPDLAVTFQHEGLLRPEDLQRLFPDRRRLAFDRRALLASYAELCRRQCTSDRVIVINQSRAEHLIDSLGDLNAINQHGIESCQNAHLTQVARKTVSLEKEVLRQPLELCVRHRWRPDNPARQVKKLPWKLSRLPQALTDVQVQEALRLAAEIPPRAGPTSLAAQRYRLLVAGIFFGLRRGELQHLVCADTNGRQAYVQGKTPPDGRTWVPKDREARVIYYYPGIERPIALVFGEGEGICLHSGSRSATAVSLRPSEPGRRASTQIPQASAQLTCAPPYLRHLAAGDGRPHGARAAAHGPCRRQHAAALRPRTARSHGGSVKPLVSVVLRLLSWGFPGQMVTKYHFVGANYTFGRKSIICSGRGQPLGRSDEALDVSVNIRVVPRHQCSPQQLAAWDHLWARLLSPDSDELLTAARWRLLELLGRRLRDLQWLADDRERYLRWLWKGEPPADTREPLPPRRRRGR